MSYQFTISDIGLRLIKAYEGYRAEPRTLASGNKVIGFGHAVNSDDMSELSEEDAEDALKSDLAPIEDLINTHVHASMTQSQFDALCSLAFSIGEEAFMSSNILHDMNKGQVIKAANGFDLWRKGNIDGQVYVVDALVRRRTAEKALFLRPTQRTARAPRYELTAIKDTDLSEAEGVVELAATAPESDAANLQGMTQIIGANPYQDNHIAVDVYEPEASANDIDSPNFPFGDEMPAMEDTSRRGLSAAPAAVLYSDDIEESSSDHTSEVPVVDLVSTDDIMDLDMVAAPPTGALSETFPDTLSPVANDSVELEESLSDEIDVSPSIVDVVETDEDQGEQVQDVEHHADISDVEPAKIDEAPAPESVTTEDESPSPIAAAAAEVSDRLDALIDEPTEPEAETEWPDSLITASIQPEATDNVPQMTEQHTADIVIDELHSDDALRQQETRDSQFNTDKYVEYTSGSHSQKEGGLWAFFTMMIVGLTLFLAGLGINWKGAILILGENGPFMTVVAMTIGALLLIGGGWYLIKALFFKD